MGPGDGFIVVARRPLARGDPVQGVLPGLAADAGLPGHSLGQAAAHAARQRAHRMEQKLQQQVRVHRFPEERKT